MGLLSRLVLVLGLFAASLPCEVLAQALTTDDYGFQLVDQHLPAEAPFGFVSVTSTKFNQPLQPGYNYKLTFSFSAKQLSNRQYTLHPSLFLTKGSEMPMELEHARTEVDAEIFNLEYAVKAGNAFAPKTSCTYFITPTKVYDFVTFVIKEEDIEGTPIQPRVDLKLSEVFVSVEESPLVEDLDEEELEEIVEPEPEPEPDSTLEIESEDYFEEEYVAVEEVDLPEDTIPASFPDEIPSPKVLLEDLPLASTKPRRSLQVNEATITVEQMPARIGLYDHKRVDGDIVTIFVNDRILVENHLLTKAVAYFDLPLQVGENSIVLFAENLGHVVPNTAAIIIESGEQRKEVVLRSDLEKSEFFTVMRK